MAACCSASCARRSTGTSWELTGWRARTGGESADAAARRECEEEIARVPARIERLGAWYPVPGYCDEEMIFFRVSDLRSPPPDSPHRPDEDEDIESRSVTIAEAQSMVARGEIVDLKTAFGSRSPCSRARRSTALSASSMVAA